MDSNNLPAPLQGELISPPSETTATGPLLSPGLKRLLTEGEDGAGACRILSLNPKLRAEAERVLPVLQAAKAPAERLDVLEILVRHAPHYGITQKLAGEWGAFFAAYLDALEDLPAYAVEDGFLRWNRGEGHADLKMASFYPKAPQLYMLAQKGKTELWMAAYRAEKALAYADKKSHEAPPPEVRKEVAGNLADLLGELKGARKMPDPFAPRVSPQQMAQQIRSAAVSPGNDASNPVEKEDVSPSGPLDDVGDVL